MSVGAPESAPHVPARLAPAAGEAGVCSLLLAKTGKTWQLASGSLLTTPVAVARTSWKRWREIQPPTSRPRREPEGFDLGPIFDAEPFPGVRAVRAVLDTAAWHAAVEGLEHGALTLPQTVCHARAGQWSPTVVLAQGHMCEGRRVVAGAQRPVRGTVAELEPIAMAPSDATWKLPLPPHIKPGPALGEMYRHRHLLHWPRALLGIDWLGGTHHPPPPRLVVGRLESDAWIAGVWPDHNANELSVGIAWDETRIDPLGCSLLLRVTRDGLLLMSQQTRISDLPTRTDAECEPRTLSWRERTLTIGLSRGPRRAEWGLGLLTSDGRLLDERPLARRYEQVTMEYAVAGANRPLSRSVVGDRNPHPSVPETDEAVTLARELTAEARKAAAQRRLSTAGDLAHYLRWRFCCRAGELLVLDRYLLGGDPERQIKFLAGLARPIRALTGSVEGVHHAVGRLPQLDVRCLPHGGPSLHDRVWIVGETGLLIGGSVSTFLTTSGRRPSATTATELPFSDVEVWRGLFESWWQASKPVAPLTAASTAARAR